MADWSTPDSATNYLTLLTDLLARDTDAAELNESPTNPPTGYIRYSRSLDKFQEWNGAAWIDKVISIAGGGTGASTASGARTALGLGSMAVQSNSAVNITGGAISGVTMDASVITSGVLGLNRGGLGASLALGTLGQILYSNGVSIAFADGDQIAKLNANNLTTGTVPLARLPTNIPFSSIASVLVALNQGGTGTDLSATGGAHQVLKQSAPGAVITVSQLAQADISDYAEGNWTPVDASGGGLVLTIGSATYTRIGRIVIASMSISIPFNTDGNAFKIGGLPFNSLGSLFGAVITTYGCFGSLYSILTNGGTATFGALDPTDNPILNSQLAGDMRITIIYEKS